MHMFRWHWWLNTNLVWELCTCTVSWQSVVNMQLIPVCEHRIPEIQFTNLSIHVSLKELTSNKLYGGTVKYLVR